jgi:small subunit ribosomal protein S3
MGRKVHPVGFRIGIIRDWQAKWYADKHYPEFIQEDVKLRKAIRSRYAEAGVSLVEIERQANRVTITIYTARPGIVIGRGGQRVDETRHYLEELINKRVQLNIQEIRQPELDAYLVARMVAEQIGRRIAYRRAMKQALFRTMQAGAKGMKICCSGRLGGVEIARRQMMHQGRVPLHTLRADIDYGFTEAHTTLGQIGIKVWIYRGDILPELEEVAAEEGLVEPEAVKEAEAAPAAEPEKPAKPRAKRVTRAKPVAAKEEKPVEPEAVKEAEAAPAAEPKKPAKPKAKRVTRAKPVTAKEEKPAEPEAVKEAEAAPAAEPEKPAKPRAKRVTRAKPVAAKEEKPVEPEAVKEAEAALAVEPEKPAKPRAKRVTRAKPVAAKEPKKKVAKKESDKTKPAKPAKEIKEEKKDATTKTGEIPQES